MSSRAVTVVSSSACWDSAFTTALQGFWPLHLKLGKLIKRNGHSQEFLFGTGLLAVQWYSSMGELIDGLMENMFAGVDYRISTVLQISLLQLLLYVWPFMGCFLTEGWTRLLNLALVSLMALFFGAGARFTNQPAWVGPGFPVMALLWIYIQWRAMLLTLFKRGDYLAGYLLLVRGAQGIGA